MFSRGVDEIPIVDESLIGEIKHEYLFLSRDIIGFGGYSVLVDKDEKSQKSFFVKLRSQKFFYFSKLQIFEFLGYLPSLRNFDS